MKTCSRDGCTKAPWARGMCGNHYTQWRNKLTTPLTKSDTRERLLAAMPGTVKQLAAALEMQYEAVRKAVMKLHSEGKCHIEDHLPPENHGRDYMAVFTRGPGEDHVVTRQQRRRDHLAARRAWYHRNESKPRTGHQLNPVDKVLHKLAA
jgi:hypothetical protein